MMRFLSMSGMRGGLAVFFLAAIMLAFPVHAQTVEKAVGTSCANGASAADFDTIAQCTATSGSGTMQKAPLFVGAVSSPPYSTTSCDSAKAGMVQYTSGSFQVCNGSSWTTLGSGGSDSCTGTGACDTASKLLLHMDGSNGGTTFTDSSIWAQSITNTGVTTSTNQSKIGSAVGYFTGSTYLLVPDSADFYYGTSDFTIDMWVYPTAVGAAKMYTSQRWASSDNSPGFGIGQTASNQVSAYWLNTAGNYYYSLAGGTIAANQWYHVAVVRYGTRTSLYLNGAEVAYTTSYSGTPQDCFGVLTVGGYYNSSTSGFGYGFSGYIDEFRISKGIARWSTAFTPPTSAYPTCVPASSCPSVASGSSVFTSSGTFTPPSGVSSSCPLKVRVLAVGGGGGGQAANSQGGGGSGNVAAQQLYLTSSSSITVTVGAAGSSSTSGTASSFDVVTAAGGLCCSASTYAGGNGGSGGGGTHWSSTSAITGGAGGSNGSDGVTKGGTGGVGQGSPIVSSATTVMGVTFQQATFVAGAGGSGGVPSSIFGSYYYGAGGGGGGILINGAGPTAGRGTSNGYGTGGSGGVGYGAGGGGGSVTAGNPGGAGAAGLVYVEW